MTPQEKATTSAIFAELKAEQDTNSPNTRQHKAERVRKMAPKENAAMYAKLAEEKAERVHKMIPEDKPVSMAKNAEQEAERVR